MDDPDREGGSGMVVQMLVQAEGLVDVVFSQLGKAHLDVRGKHGRVGQG